MSDIETEWTEKLGCDVRILTAGTGEVVIRVEDYGYIPAGDLGRAEEILAGIYADQAALLW